MSGLQDGGAVEQIGIANILDAGDVILDAYLNQADIHLRLRDYTFTATGSTTRTSGLIMLNHASTIIALTMSTAPTAGDVLIIYNTSASGTAAHTVTLPSGVTFVETGASGDVATLNAPNEFLVCVATSATIYRVLVNGNSVAFS